MDCAAYVMGYVSLMVISVVAETVTTLYPDSFYKFFSWDYV